MRITGEPKAKLNDEAREFIQLYGALGERAETILPEHVFEKLRNFVRLCLEEQFDPQRQQAEIEQYLLSLKESLPGYTEVSLMLTPHRDSKAFEYSARRNTFRKRMQRMLDHDLVEPADRKRVENILNLHDFSVGTPPVSQPAIDFMYRILVGDEVRVLRKFREVIGICDGVEEAQWNYLLDVIDQMVMQASHYTNQVEKEDFLARTETTIGFKGLNGLIRTLVSGTAETAIKLLCEEVFTPESVRVVDYTGYEALIETLRKDPVSIFAVKATSLREKIISRPEFAPFLVRTIFIDNSTESRASNTALVFSFHNGVIRTLNKAHTKKMGTPANTQMNLRLILDKVHPDNLTKYRNKIELRLKEFDQEIAEMKREQVVEPNSPDQDINLLKFDEFARQLIKDKYTLSKLLQFITLLEEVREPARHKKLNKELITEFEQRTLDYFYSGSKKLEIATIIEGGGRTQIKMYGEYLLKRKLKPVKEEIIHRCNVILDVIPNTYQRTLHNHFHKNFGINLFLEKYKAYLTKVENEADNRGRFRNFLIDLGIKERFDKQTPDDQDVIKDFLSKLATLDKTSVSDDVQMIIRDLLFWKGRQPNPFIYFIEEASWEYRDLFPPDRFDINPFDINIELFDNGRVDFERLHLKLERIRDTFHLFDDTGTLWDRFCENTTFVINDPANPTGYTDFNNEVLLRFLKFVNKTKITLFLDEAYNDAVKLEDPEEPKWRTLSRYIVNNHATYPTISMVTSLSTTKNLGATGDRLGSLAATLARKDVIDYARKQFSSERANTHSLYMLVNILQVAQLSKLIKDRMDENLPKDASRHKIKARLEAYIKEETIHGLFDGSPLHVFLLDELKSLDQLDVLELPDDFKYKGEPFFSYYKEHIVKALNKFRVNKEFRRESNLRLTIAKEVAEEVLARHDDPQITYLDSDGSYLFNLHLLGSRSFADLEAFCSALAENRGLAVIPYQTGFVRYSLGGYLDGTENGNLLFRREVETAIELFLHYWKRFESELSAEKPAETSQILSGIFSSDDQSFIQSVLTDFKELSSLTKTKNVSLRIRDTRSLYLPSPSDSGVTIDTIATSKNSVIEFYENIGSCPDLESFISSKAFSIIYENLLAQIYKSIPHIRNLSYQEVLARYGKSTLLKYVRSKREFLPADHILDGPDEWLVMKEILMELEQILFSDAKVKLLAIKVNETDSEGDLARLEGYNQILRKFIRDLLLHFDLPFDKRGDEPTYKELFVKSVRLFHENTGIELSLFQPVLGLMDLRRQLRPTGSSFPEDPTSALIQITDSLLRQGLESLTEMEEKLWIDYLASHDGSFATLWKERTTHLISRLKEVEAGEARLIAASYLKDLFREECASWWDNCLKIGDHQVDSSELALRSRQMVMFLTGRVNRIRSTKRYSQYNHILIRMLLYHYRAQNSSVNEMIQHGYALHTGFKMDNLLSRKREWKNLAWINRIMELCGVIAAEKDVQSHTRVATDAKKREFPFHMINRTGLEPEFYDQNGPTTPRDFIKQMKTRPTAMFFGNRLKQFVENLDPDDYRCKIFDQGLVKELYIFRKSYLKYLADNFRLLGSQTVSLKELKEFVPDIVIFYGAPEKLISYPRIGYFDLPGPNGNIKTLVTPLKRKVDYFGDIKKPRLTLMNEKVKEMGGMPVHGSFFAVEEEDGTIFTVMISGDSGVGKSEMLAALMLKWLRKDLTGIRLIKLIAGDMLHVFPDDKGNLYGIGTEVGDFSRVTDFDPDFIRQYKPLFETSADSNVEDLNSRSTISGFCDISMPMKIDIFLTASNFSREEAGIRRYANPENFILYRESHGERKEKATSSDNPHIQRTLLRYTADKTIVELLSKHGAYLDDILDWITDPVNGKVYLGSSFTMIDKIDLEEVVATIFLNKEIKVDGKKLTVNRVRFDIIKNRFHITAASKEYATTLLLDREIFSQVFNALASTPAGNPFIAEEEELDIKKNLIRILKGGSDGKGAGRKIQLGILSTDLGRKGKELSGPRKAAEDLLRLIREVRLQKHEITDQKQTVRQRISEKYGHLLPPNEISNEIFRYNFYLYQLELMRKARFVRMDNGSQMVDLSGMKSFKPIPSSQKFSPLLITPNIHIEISTASESWEQLIHLPNNREYAHELFTLTDDLFIAEGYEKDLNMNNLIIQLLLKSRHLSFRDLATGRITEKVNRETLAAARWAIEERLKLKGTDNNK